MKKLFMLFLLLACLYVNGQDFSKEIKFTAISSEKYGYKVDSILKNTISIDNGKVKSLSISIYQMVNLRTDDLPSVKQITEIKSLNSYKIAERFIFTRPEWNQINTDAFGFKLSYIIR